MTQDPEPAFEDLPGVELTTCNGLPAVSVRTEAASALVYLQGAHLAAWQPAGHEPVIWMSPRALYTPGKALRGGVPLCFPWFGEHAEHPDYPAHGFARVMDFQYRGARREHAGNVWLEFLLESDERTLPYFPHPFRVRMRFSPGSTLALELTVTNCDTRPFSYEEALHSYFRVEDVREVRVRGLQGARYTDKVRGMAVFEETAPELRLTAETDRVYESSAGGAIVDDRAKRSLHIAKADSAATVVWNPWAEKAARMSDLGADGWAGMLCVESANVANSRVTLGPAESHTLRVEVSVDSSIWDFPSKA